MRGIGSLFRASRPEGLNDDDDADGDRCEGTCACVKTFTHE